MKSFLSFALALVILTMNHIASARAFADDAAPHRTPSATWVERPTMWSWREMVANDVKIRHLRPGRPRNPEHESPAPLEVRSDAVVLHRPESHAVTRQNQEAELVPLMLRNCAGLAYPPIVPSLNFSGFTDNATSIPPDTMGAVGPTHIVSMFNQRVLMYTRSGSLLGSVSLDTFWAPVAFWCFDPHIKFDVLSQRWIATIVAESQSASSKVCLAISETSDPTGNWAMYQFDADAGNTLWADFPAIGLNDTWIAISVNMFQNSGAGFVGSKLWVFDKRSLLSGAGLTVSTFGIGFDDTGTGRGFTLQPVVCLDSSADELYMFDNGWVETTTQKRLMRGSKITGSGQSPVWSTLPGNFSNPVFGLFRVPDDNQFGTTCPGAPQLGDSRLIESALSTRLINAVYRAGIATFVHSAGYPPSSPDRTVSFWHQFRPDTPSAPFVQSGRLDGGPGVWHCFPSIAVNCAGDIAIGCSRMAADRYAESVYAIRLSSEAPNTFGPVRLIQAGLGSYYKTFGGSRNRWGDYSATIVDPLDDATFWTIQEHAAQRVGPSNDGSRFAANWAKLGSGGCTLSWQERSPGMLPSTRSDHAMAFDSLRGRVVMFGGSVPPDGALNDTWEWDGDRWSRVALDLGPLERRRGGMVFDSARQVCVYFGGRRPYSTTHLAETWTWNGITWQLAASGGPPAREGMAMAWDSLRQRVVMFGGHDAAVYRNDVWEWNGITWTDVTPTSGSQPIPRDDAAMAFDPARGKVVLHGGFGNNGVVQSDTWEWDGTSWARTADGPVGRFAHRMDYVPQLGGVVAFAGSHVGTTVYSDLIVYDGITWTPVQGFTPMPRYAHGMVYDSARSVLFMTHGVSPSLGALQDSWTHHGTRWVPAAGPNPAGRYGASAAFSQSRQQAILFGGALSGGSVTNDLWTASTKAWGRVSTTLNGFSGRSFAAIIDEPPSDGGRIWVHGGLDANGTARNDTWRLVNGQWMQANTAFNGPPRYDAASCYFASTNRFIVFGGTSNGSNVLAQPQYLLTCCSSTWDPMGGPTPSARRGAVMAYDPIRDEAILFGGKDASGIALYDTWRLKYVDGLAEWTLVPTSLNILNAWQNASLTWNPQSQRLVLFGKSQAGFDVGAPVFNSVWEWTGNDWLPIHTSNTPPLRDGATLVPTSISGDLVLVGGRVPNSQSAFASTYNFLGQARIRVDGPITGGGNVSCGSTLQLAVPQVAGLDLRFRWFRDAVPLVDGATASGSTIAGATLQTLTITGVGVLEEGLYSCMISNDCSPADEQVSDGGAVTVQGCCEADFNADGSLDFFDYLDFVAAFSSANTQADFNSDTVIDFFDYLDFVAAFSTGC